MTANTIDQTELQRAFIRAIVALDFSSTEKSNREEMVRSQEKITKSIEDGLLINESIVFESLQDYTPLTFSLPQIKSLVYASEIINGKTQNDPPSIDESETHRLAKNLRDLIVKTAVKQANEIGINSLDQKKPSEHINLINLCPPGSTEQTQILLDLNVPVDIEFLERLSIKQFNALLNSVPKFETAVINSGVESTDFLTEQFSNEESIARLDESTINNLHAFTRKLLPNDFANIGISKICKDHIAVNGENINAFIEAGADPLGKRSKDPQAKSLLWELMHDQGLVSAALALASTHPGSIDIHEIHDDKSLIKNAIDTRLDDLVKVIAQQGAKLLQTTVPGGRSLHTEDQDALIVAASHNMGFSLDLAIEHGANISFPIEIGIYNTTALISAGMNNHPDIVEKLLNAGAKIDQVISKMVKDGPYNIGEQQRSFITETIRADSANALFAAAKFAGPDILLTQKITEESPNCQALLNAFLAKGKLPEMMDDLAQDHQNMKETLIELSKVDGDHEHKIKTTPKPRP